MSSSDSTLHVADMSLSQRTNSYFMWRTSEPSLVRDAMGVSGAWQAVESVDYGVQVIFVVRSRGCIQFAIQKESAASKRIQKIMRSFSLLPLLQWRD